MSQATTIPATNVEIAEAGCATETLSLLRKCIHAASRAPSGDNVQPWTFAINAAHSGIDVYLDACRDTSSMNSGQRMSLIACGAAIENIHTAAAELGWESGIEFTDARSAVETGCTLVARIHFTARASERTAPRLFKEISIRVVNRRLYDARPICAPVLTELTDHTPILNGVRTDWICDRDALTTLSALIGRGDAIMFGESSMRAAFLANVRFDLPANAEADEGLPLASLEASIAVQISLRAMPRIPDAIFKVMYMHVIFAAHARALVKSASGICVVSVDDQTPPPERRAALNIGRSMQRAWLAMTELGIFAQPMMSLLVLDNALRNGSAELIAALNHDGAPELIREFRSFLARLGISGRPGFLMRFGYAAAPSGRTGRRDGLRA